MYFDEKKEQVERIKPAFMRAKEACEYLAIKKTKFNDLVRAGRITKCYIDTCVVFSVKQLDNFHDDVFEKFYGLMAGENENGN